MHIVVQADLDSHNQTLVGRLREIFHSFSKEIGGGYFGGCAVGGVGGGGRGSAAKGDSEIREGHRASLKCR